jgi:hypothetical protein
MYGLGIWENGENRYLRSAEIASLLAGRLSGGDVVGMRHLVAIERLESRGMSYSNEDFDVLSAAHSYAERLAKPSLN